VSGFKLAKNTVLAVKTTLRGDMMNQFCYKWYFISAQQDNAVKKTGWEYDQGNS
jgi:ribosomal protein L5